MSQKPVRRKVIHVPVRFEFKTHFANERTFTHYLRVGLLIYALGWHLIKAARSGKVPPSPRAVDGHLVVGDRVWYGWRSDALMASSNTLGCTVRCARAVQKVGYFGPVSPNWPR